MFLLLQKRRTFIKLLSTTGLMTTSSDRFLLRAMPYRFNFY